MAEATRETVTRLLAELGEGRRKSFDRLFPLVYGELRALARRVRRHDEGRDPTLDTTSLVHEAYLRLVDQSRADWRSRGHFNAVASKAMRHILIDYARRGRAAKRGGGQAPVSLDATGFPEPGVWEAGDDERLIALDRALEKLALVSERQTSVVEMRFFGGMTIEEIAGALDLSPATVKRAWSTAQAWLYREMEPGS
jgi:RNA polymerase sigma factor (TIGR02999 family)